jgi:hypothetical protein
MNVIDLSVFDCDIRVECGDRQAVALLNGNYYLYDPHGTRAGTVSSLPDNGRQ